MQIVNGGIKGLIDFFMTKDIPDDAKHIITTLLNNTDNLSINTKLLFKEDSRELFIKSNAEEVMRSIGTVNLTVDDKNIWIVCGKYPVSEDNSAVKMVEILPNVTHKVVCVHDNIPAIPIEKTPCIINYEKHRVRCISDQLEEYLGNLQYYIAVIINCPGDFCTEINLIDNIIDCNN